MSGGFGYLTSGNFGGFLLLKSFCCLSVAVRGNFFVMRWFLIALFLVGSIGEVAAKPIEVLGGELVTTIEPDDGFVDDAFAFDSGGRRFAWIRSTATGVSEIHTYDLVQKAELSHGVLKGIPQDVSTLQFVQDGRQFAWFKEGEKTRGGLFSDNGRSIRKFAAASELSITTLNGREYLSTYRSVRGKSGSENHSVELTNLATGKRLGKATTFSVNSRGVNSALGFRLSHFKDGHRIAVGVKSGAWDPETKIRSLDTHAEYSLTGREFVKKLEIEDLKAHREFLAVRQNGPASDRFLEPVGDQLVLAGDELSPITLAEPFTHYDGKTLSTRDLGDGSILFAIQIDPVHPEAAKAKRAEKKWTDVYLLAVGDAKAKRIARVFVRGEEPLVWQGTSEFLAILDEHVGFERGGPRLRVYKIGKELL